MLNGKYDINEYPLQKFYNIYNYNTIMMRYGLDDWDLALWNNPIFGDDRIHYLNFNVNQISDQETNSYLYNYYIFQLILYFLPNQKT